MTKEEIKQKLAVRKYVEYLKGVADVQEIPHNMMEALELKSFIRQLNDYRLDILWARKNLGAECHDLTKIINELEVKLKYYENSRSVLS